MRKLFGFLGLLVLFIVLTLLTQIGGIVLVMSKLLAPRIPSPIRAKALLIFLALYVVGTFAVVPALAPLFGRERVEHTDKVRPATFTTVLFNRNYVRPDMNELLASTASNLGDSPLVMNYLDANFPFFDGFPLLPHLSHSDGKKLDLSLVYETTEGEISGRQKSVSGYGNFVGPGAGETDQIQTCLDQGYFQYDFTKYLTLGTKNKDLVFSERGTETLISQLLQSPLLGKLFIEPHLKERLHLDHPLVRFHGCRAVRHDDHIHLQLK